MTNSQVNQAMAALLRQFELPQLPDYIVDRDGRRMDLSGLVWKFNVATEHVAVDWSGLTVWNLHVIYAVRRWAILLLTQLSGNTVAIEIDVVLGALHGRPNDVDTASAELRGMWHELSVIDEPAYFGEAEQRFRLMSNRVFAGR